MKFIPLMLESAVEGSQQPRSVVAPIGAPHAPAKCEVLTSYLESSNKDSYKGETSWCTIIIRFKNQEYIIVLPPGEYDKASKSNNILLYAVWGEEGQEFEVRGTVKKLSKSQWVPVAHAWLLDKPVTTDTEETDL